MHKGSCLCGAVTFEVAGDLPAPDACHCSKCRKTSGHYYASTDVKREALQVHGAENVAWFQSSEKVRRGFCRTCGSNLFFDPVIDTDWTAVSMGAFDTPTQAHLAVHIFTADKGDYYDIADGVRQEEKPPC
ncbi:MAG TPA: GFA family protein [Aliiroseovarius sp.]|nr:GFA family protein [Aliiroseovarius sp.]